MSMYKEVRITHLDPKDQFWRVDAWETDEDEEAGKVIAYIDDITRRVLYHDPVARIDKLAQEAIQAKIAEIDDKVTVRKATAGYLAIEMETKYGTLLAEVQTSEYDGDLSDAIYTQFKPKDMGETIDLVAAKVENDSATISLYEWSDPYTDEYQTKTVLEIEDILFVLDD